MSFHADQHEVDSRQAFGKRRDDTNQQPAYDLVCVGFGTTCLPVAAALADGNSTLRVLIIEKEERFTWNPESLLPDKPVGTSFLHDLATMQNPRSTFTFMNYLHATGQIIGYANNSRLAPSRRQMGNYFSWAANKIEQLGWIEYGQEAVRIAPVKNARQVVRWVVQTRNTTTGAVAEVHTRRVVIATGARPHVPSALAAPPLNSLVYHASACADVLAKATNSNLSIAVLGAGQDAAEIFEELGRRKGQHTATLFFADSALRPESSMLKMTKSQPSILPPEIRERLHSGDLTSPQVSLATLESLYLMRYTQQIALRDANKWRFQIKCLSEVVEAKQEQGRVRLVVKNCQTGEVTMAAQAFDVVIAATGYDFAIDGHLIVAILPLLHGGAMSVDREYRVNFRRDTLARDCGLWMLGSLDDVRRRGDDFSCMAERGHRVAKSVQNHVSSDMRTSSQRFEQAVL